MTDKEIIKALECHQSTRPNCAECPFHKQPEDCLEQMQRDAIDLIRRQQAEIDKLLVQSGHFDTFARNLCGIRLRNGNKIATFEDLQSYISKQKAEAVREFTERLKTKLAALEYKTNTHRRTCSVDYVDKTVNWTLHDITSAEIDNLVNELYGNPEEVKCKDCKHLMYSDCYGECSQGYKGIVQPDDSCKYGERKLK
jgi:hypothetical protein